MKQRRRKKNCFLKKKREKTDIRKGGQLFDSVRKNTNVLYHKQHNYNLTLVSRSSDLGVCDA